MKILLIGSAGLIGQDIVTLLEQKHIEHVAPERDELDLEHLGTIKRCLQCHQPTIVISSASYNHPIHAESEPMKCMRINRDAMALLAKTCHKIGAILIYISSYRVFDGRQKAPYTEQDDPNPLGILATSRWEAEQLIQQYCPRHIILRLSWVISHRHTNLLRHFLDQISEQRELAVVSDQMGCPTPTDDAARVIVAIVQQLDCGAKPWGTYHYAGAETVSENQFAEIVIAEAMQHQALTIRTLKTDKRGERHGVLAPANAVLNSHKILSTFGIHSRSWRGSLVRIIRQYYEEKNNKPAR